MVTDLLKQDGRVVGAIGIPRDSRDVYIFKAKATVLTAGASAMKPWGTRPVSNLTGDGMAMAYRAGAEITGNEWTYDAPRTGRTLESTLVYTYEEGDERHWNALGEEVLGTHSINPLEVDMEVHAGILNKRLWQIVGKGQW